MVNDIRKYMNLFENQDRNSIEKILRSNFDSFDSYEITSEGIVNVEGSVYVNKLNKEGTIGIQFGEVTHSFDCVDRGLISLIGFPNKIGRNLHLNSNRLTSLKGSPREIGRVFDCSGNQLTSLEGGPQIVNEHFLCYSNPLVSLNGLPDKCKEVHVNWTPDLPLLRLVGRGVLLYNNSEINPLMKKYGWRVKGTRSDILACQRELIENGFEGNAKW